MNRFGPGDRRLRTRTWLLSLLVFCASGGLTYALAGNLGGPDAPPQARPRARDASAEVQSPALAAGILPVLARPERAAPTPLPELSRESAEEDGQDPVVIRVVAGHMGSSGTLASALGDQAVDSALIHEIGRAMRPVFDFRKARAGDFFSLLVDESGNLLTFEYQNGRYDIYKLERDATGQLRAKHEQAPLERRVVRLGGVVERSLFQAVLDLGEHPELVQAIADIFIWDMDFATQTRPGDQFRVVIEKFYDSKGFARYGDVLAAQYRNGERDFTAVYYEDTNGYGDYFTPDGNSLRRSFLRAPVKYTRISSRYTGSRLHPLLRMRRPHRGIDYAAPTGTPVWAVADGTVIFKGWNGGFGRLVKVRHDNGYVSFYGHLSAFGKGVEVGRRVHQRQIIGRVGSTGLATGPHLDYRLHKNGQFVDPLQVRFPEGKPVPVAEQRSFQEVARNRLDDLKQASPPLVLETGM